MYKCFIMGFPLLGILCFSLFNKDFLYLSSFFIVLSNLIALRIVYKKYHIIGTSTYKTKQLTLTHRAIIISSVTCGSYFVFFAITNQTYLFIIETFVLLIFFASLLYYYTGYIRLSKFILITNVHASIFYFANILGDKTNTHVLFLVTLWLAIFIFDTKEWKNIVYSMFLSVICFFSIHFLEIKFIESYEITGIASNIYIFLIYFVTFVLNIVFLMNIILVNKKSEENLVFSKEELEKKVFELDLANTEIHNKKLSLENSNNSLKEANKKLKETARQEVFLKMGREIQAQFLPEVPKELKICNSTYHFETMYKPSNEVSGDLYDFYVQNNKIKVFHSDVIGKNVPAMMVALNIHSELKRLLKQEDEEPQTLINELNKNIYAMRARMSGCAGVYYEIDTETQKLTYVHMGYEDIYLIRGKKFIDIGSEGGPPLGGFENISYKQTSIAFKEGDMLLTISDGMSDMKNEAGKRYSQDVGVKTHIARYIESAGSKTTETLKEWLETEINRYTGNTDVYADDISVFITSLDIS